MLKSNDTKKMEIVTITAYTDDILQIEAIEAILKAMKVKFKLEKEGEIIKNNIEEGLKEVALFEIGELKTTPALDFLDEI